MSVYLMAAEALVAAPGPLPPKSGAARVLPLLGPRLPRFAATARSASSRASSPALGGTAARRRALAIAGVAGRAVDGWRDHSELFLLFFFFF